MDDVRFCRNCGKMIQPGERFCSNCGTPVSTGSDGAISHTSEDSRYTSSPTPAQYRPTSTSNGSVASGTDVAGFVCGLISVILCALLFAIIGLVLSSKNKGKNKMATAGFILSVIGLVFSIIFLLYLCIMLFMQH